ncbi:MAG: TetR/AcrR family transcriptional regulator [Candidatus Kapaibacterium sp.]
MIAEITERQLEIIEASGKILTERGVSGLTLKNIAKEMKFSESAVYRHFKSKEDIIITMLNYLAEIMNMNLSRICKSDKPSQQRLVEVFQSQLDFFEENPNFVVAVFSDGLFEESQKINEAIQRIMVLNMKNVIPLVAEGQAKGEFINTMKPDELMHIAMGSFRLQMYKWRISNMNFNIQIEGKRVINNFITLVTP